MTSTPAHDPALPEPALPEWAALFYLCGHYDRADTRDPFLDALDDLRAVHGTAVMPAAVFLDLESGAQRVVLGTDGSVESELIGAVNSGDPQTLAQYVTWAFDACPARHYILVMAGLGIMDAASVVGRPPFDSARTFAICDDRATADAIELHELSATIRTLFPPAAPHRLAILACDMYAMQFMEVAYELRGCVDLLVGIQPDERRDGLTLRQWPYARLLRRWQAIAAAPAEGAVPRWRSGLDARALTIVRETVKALGEHYTAVEPDAHITVSAVNLTALAPLAQAFDTFSVVLLQWLGNDVIWRAREQTVQRQLHAIEHSWSYDLDEVSLAVRAALVDAAGEALVRWAASTIPALPYPRLSPVLRILTTTARELSGAGDPGGVYGTLAADIAACRSAIERAMSAVGADPAGTKAASPEIASAVRRLFMADGPGDQVREPAAWSAIIGATRERLGSVSGRELADAFDGIEAAQQLARLARRVSDLARGADQGQQAAIAALWPEAGHCGLALYRPVDLDKLAESNYLQLRFSRELHWTALLTAVDLIKCHARMLWRLLESQLTGAPLEARYQLMRRLAGERALTGRHAGQLQALSAPEAIFLTIEPDGTTPGCEMAAPSDSDASIVPYCVRLSSLDRSSTVIERRNPVTSARLAQVLAEIDAIGGDVTAQPVRTLQRLKRCGSLLGDDLLYGISDRLAEVQPVDGRFPHLVLQMPRDLMRYPWELLCDRHGWLVDRFAIGRQVIADADTVPRWMFTRRQGPLRLLVVAPAIEGSGAELAGAGSLEGRHVAEVFGRLQERLPGIVDPSNFLRYVNQPVTVEEFRGLVRERRYDIVHFAGHGRFDAGHPERSCWLFSDGPLYAFELRHTLANAAVTPWLVYGSACEGSRESERPRGYHDGVYGMASAVLGEGVAAYVGPLWTISDTDARNMAAAFYDALLLRRVSLGEALSLARRSVYAGEPDLDALASWRHSREVTSDESPPQSAGWTGLVLYGDPTPTVLQRLSPSDGGGQSRPAEP